MSNALVRKLQSYVHLSHADTAALDAAMCPLHAFGARRDVLLEGDDPRVVNVVLEGWACHYKQFTDGRRQIVSLLLPGDCCDPQITLLRRLDYGLVTVTPATFAQIPGVTLRALLADNPALEHAFFREQLATAAIQREWTASLGRRSALERLAHLFCELHQRLAVVGQADGPSCPMPLTQVDLADSLGQTSVHINRTLQDLRNAGLITLRNRHLTILDAPGLRRVAQFSPDYLHLGDQDDGAGRPRE